MENIANWIYNHIWVIILVGFLSTLLVLVYNYYIKRKAEKDPNNLAYYFKKYNLDTYQDAWKVVNDPHTPNDDRQKIAALIEFYHKINKS